MFGSDNQDIVDEGDDNYRSRKKEDIFHWFQNLPIGKRVLARPIISRLLIHATFIFDKEDFGKIEKFLQTNKKIIMSDPSYTNKVMRHFYHNREWWRIHCRMYIPKALQHATRVKRIVA